MKNDEYEKKQGRWHITVLIISLIGTFIGALYFIPKVQEIAWADGEPGVEWQVRSENQVRLLAEAVQRHAPPTWQGELNDEQILKIIQHAWPDKWQSMVGTDPLKKQRVCDAWGQPIVVSVEQESVRVQSAGSDGTMSSDDDIVLIYQWQKNNAAQ